MSSYIDPFFGEHDNNANPARKFKLIRTYNADNQLSGNYEEYNGDGRLVRKCFYVANKLHGSCLVKVFTNGELIQATKTFYINGVLNGPAETKKYKSFQMFNKVSCMYQDGKLNGLYEETCYNNVGDIIFSYKREYIDNVLNGPFIESNNTLTREGTYVNGEYDGVIITTMKTNGIKYYISYKKGVFDRVVDAYDIMNRNMMLTDVETIVWKAGINGSTKVYVKLKVYKESAKTEIIMESDAHRVSRANVLEIFDASGNTYSTCTSLIKTDTPLIYTVGSDVVELSCDTNIFNKYGQGIYCYKYKEYVVQLM